MADVFTLEALQAEQGDCLLLHFGTTAKPSFVLIDGGPRGVYPATLKPRLQQLRKKFVGQAPLALDACMVSHIDSDHIRGILDLAKELEHEPYCRIRDFWYNSFDEVLGNLPPVLKASVAGLASAGDSAVAVPAGLEDASAVLAGVAEGRDLRRKLVQLGARINGGDGELLTSKSPVLKLRSGSSAVTFRILMPNAARLKALYRAWEKHLKAKPADRAGLAAYADRSVANLSSLVMLATCDGRTMLLTGDARGDDILAGLQAAKLLKKGRLHVDVLKVPHHGSDRNVTAEFYEAITADHYVISANGEHHNPDYDTFEWIGASRPAKAKYTIHLTYLKSDEDVLRQTLAKVKKQLPAVAKRIVAPKGKATSVKVDLAAPVSY